MKRHHLHRFANRCSCGWRGVLVFTCMRASHTLLLAQGAAEGDGPAAGSQKRVLVIDQEGATRPAFVLFMEGFRKGLAQEATEPFDVFVENLDLVRLGQVGRDFVLGARDVFSSHAKVVAVARPGEPPFERSVRGW